jgi:hypothetical protein
MDKRAARIGYYEGIRTAALEHFKITEEGLRKLKDMDASKVEKLVADVHKRHEKLLNRIDGLIKEEKASQR